MNYRHGTCSSCGAHFRVPASFQADKAKCKNCGGVVEIGPAEGAEGAAAKSTGAPAPKPVPARPVASRPAATGAADKPATQPDAPAAGSSARPAAAGKGDSVRAAAEAAAQRVRSAGTRTSRPAAEGAAKAERAARPSRARGGTSSTRHRAAPKKRNFVPMIVAFVVLAAIGGTAWWFFNQSGGEGEVVAGSPALEGQEDIGANDGAEETTTAPEETPPAEEESAPVEGASDEPAAEEPPAEKPPANPDELDLSTFPDEEKLPGTSDEDWTQIRDWMASYIDPAAGAAGNRARVKLLERGRESFPAILNAFKRIDFSTEAGMRAGDLAQRLLTDICSGQNFDWHFSIEPADELFNKKVVRLWIISWQQAREAPAAWAKLTKTELADAEKLFEKTGPFLGQGGPIKADSLDDF